MKYCRKYNRGKGVALIIILLLIAAITVIGLGFIVRGDTELLCGQNMELKADMDYLAESGLEHAAGLILHPQDISTDYWAGAVRQQINSGSNDYYDVNVLQLSSFNYRITSLGYRENGGQVTSQESLTAELRLNPCIVYWQSKNDPVSASVVIAGDVYFDKNTTNSGAIYGSVYSAKQVTNNGWIQGQVYEDIPETPVDLPEISPSNYSSRYYIGVNSYSVGQLAALYNGLTLSPGGTNPAGVYYRGSGGGDLILMGTVNINGTLVVKGDLTIQSGGNVTIQAVKNFPALIVGGKINMSSSNTRLTVTGYTQVDKDIDLYNRSGNSIVINGALYMLNGGMRNTSNCSIFINGMPHKACLGIWSSGGNLTRWSPATDAFYKSITRNP